MCAVFTSSPPSSASKLTLTKSARAHHTEGKQPCKDGWGTSRWKARIERAGVPVQWRSQLFSSPCSHQLQMQTKFINLSHAEVPDWGRVSHIAITYLQTGKAQKPQGTEMQFSWGRGRPSGGKVDQDQRGSGQDAIQVLPHPWVPTHQPSDGDCLSGRP